MVPISPQAYSAEAVVFDTKPLFDYAQRLDERRAKRALAEQEAVDKYVEQTQKNLTPTGMRSQDIPGFQKMQDDFRSLANQYKNTKDPIKRFQLQKKGDEMFLYIQRSKEEEKRAEPARAALANPENRKKLNVPKMMEALSVHDLPLDFEGVTMLGIPQRRSIDPNASYFRETPFSFKENFDKAATGPGIKFSELSITSGGKVNKITEGFNVPTIKSIATNFVDLVDADEDKKSYYTIRARDPKIYPSTRLAEMDKKVKQYFPNITVDDEDWRSVALAEAIEEAEKRNAEKFENAPKISVSTSGEVPKKGEEFTGNIIDNFPNTPLSRGNKPIGSIQNGVVYDNAGNFYTGELRTAYEQLPADLPAILKVANIKLSKDPKLGISVEVKNGVIQSIKQDKSPRIGRQFIENAQKKFGKKGMVFGPQGEQGFIDDPLGILEQQ